MAMHVATLRAFLDELQGIHKAAGVRDALKAGTKALLQTLPSKANSLALKGMAKAHSVPGGKHVVNYLADPSNAQDLAQSIGKILS